MSVNAQEIQKNKIKNNEITSFFDCLADILLKYSGGALIHAEDFRKYFSPYMLCRYISMKEQLIPYAEYLNFFQTTLTYEEFYLLAYKLIPKQTSGYIKYIKKAKQSKEEKDEDKINSNNIDNILFNL
jgi:hypothetical protein